MPENSELFLQTATPKLKYKQGHTAPQYIKKCTPET